MAKKDFMSLMKAKTADVRPSLLSAEENIKQQIVVLDELRDLIPPLTADEVAQLEQNLRQYGVKDPLTIWETTALTAGTGDDETPVYVLIDGHNRFSVINQYKLDFRINLVHVESMTQVKEYMIDYQLGRRNLSPEQASYLRGMRYNQLKIARGSNLNAESAQQNVAESLATEYGVSSRTIKRDGEFAAGIEKLEPVLKKEVLSGKAKLSKTRIAELAKTGVTGEADSSTASEPEPATMQKQRLQTEIRELANGKLDKRSCARLVQKINELMQL